MWAEIQDSRLLYYLIREIKTWLNINNITVGVLLYQDSDVVTMLFCQDSDVIAFILYQDSDVM